MQRFGAAGGAASSFVTALQPIDTGITTVAMPSHQVALDEYLVNGSTAYEFHLLLTASAADPFVACDVIGTATQL